MRGNASQRATRKTACRKSRKGERLQPLRGGRQYSYPSPMDKIESLHYGKSARLHQGMLGKPGAVLPGWRRVRERIGRSAQQENWMKVLAVSALPMGRCYPSARPSSLQPTVSSQNRWDTSPGKFAPNSLKTKAGHPKEVRHPGSPDLHQSPILYTKMNMNRNRRKPLKTNDPCTL